MVRTRISVIFSILVLVGLVLTACQPQTIIETVVVTQMVAGTPVEKVIEKVVTPTPIPPTKVPPTPVAKPVDALVIALQQEPDTLHPLLGSMAARTYVINMIYVGCMGQNEKLEWIPLGCESVPTVDNGGAKLVGEGDDKHLEVTYKIRKDWRWNDAKPVTTKDVLYWWKLQMDPLFEIAGRSVIEKVYDIVAVDDKTAVVKYMSKKQLNQAIQGTLTGNVDFKSYKQDYVDAYGSAEWAYYSVDPIFWTNFNWLPEHVLAKVPAKDHLTSEYARNPLGDGPYQLKTWKAGQELVLEKSAQPFPLGDAKIKTVTFRLFGDGAGVLAALKKGEVDSAMGNVAGLTEANGPDLDAIEKLGLIKVDWIKGYNFEHIDLNTQKVPLDDVRVRQALALAIDRKAINDAIFYGKKAITDLPLPKGMGWAYPPESEISLYPTDLAKAKQLLKDAGWDCATKPCTKKDKDGKTIKLEFTLMTTDRLERQKAAQIIQAAWGQLNAGVNIQFLYGRGLFQTCSAGGPLYCRTFDAAMYTFGTDDSATFIGLYGCSSIPTKENNWSGQNSPGWCNKSAQDALNSSENNPEIALSQTKRLPYIKTFFKELTKEMPVIFLYGSAEPYPHLVNWKNWKASSTQFTYPTWNSWEWEVSK